MPAERCLASQETPSRSCGVFSCRYCYIVIAGIRTGINRGFRSTYVTRCPETGLLNVRCEHGCHHCCNDDDCIVCDHCDLVNDDCECPRCEHCGDKSDSTCNCCDRCSDCCNCEYCDNCDNHVESTCANCNYCDGCCEGHGDDVSISPTRHKVWQGEGRLVGLEVEYSRSEDFNPIEKWAYDWYSSVHSDGSCGWECVTSPASGEYLERQVTQLARALKSASASHDRACGVHVHVDARDLRARDIRRLAKLYVALEPILYVIGGDFRVGTHYCAPNGKKLYSRMTDSGHKNWVYGLLSGIYPSYNTDGMVRSYLKTKPDKKDSHRYAGLNLCPWVAGRISRAKDTTIEFRMHRNCHDAVRLLNWSKLCAAIVDFAKSHTDRDLDDILSVDSARLAMYVAPGLSDWILGRIKAWRSDVNSQSYVVYRHKRWMFRNGDRNA